MPTIERFFSGFIWLGLLTFVAMSVLVFFMLCAASGLCLVWSAINGLLYLASHRRDIGQQSLYFLLGAIGFSIVVVIQGAIWDALSAVRRIATR